MDKEFNRSRSLFEVTIRRPVAITMIVIGIMVFGFLSYKQLTLNLMPDITYPSLTVRTEYPGTAPEEVETAISRPIEEELGVVTNLVNIRSISKAGQSDVILEFNWDTDMDEAISEVREKLDLIFLPQDAKKPIILRYDPSLDPIIRLGLTGGPDLFYTRYIAEEQIKRELETVDGVAAVKVKGGLEEEIRVELDEKKLSLRGIDIQRIRDKLARENINLAGGNLKEGQTEYIVRTLNEFRSVEEIGNLILSFENGRHIRLKDMGRVYRTSKERQIITHLNGRESVELEIYKEGDANIIEVARRVREKVFGTPEQQAFVKKLRQEKAKPRPGKPPKMDPRARRQAFLQQLKMRQMTNFINYNLPKGLKLELLTDQSVFIRNSLKEVKNTAIMGGILAVIVLFFFLNNLKTTLIVGLSIPLSIVATFAPMRLFGVSLNVMSLGGLALGIGMLVDNSIVVTESIFRCREEGDSLLQAVVRGVSEVGAAVTASTLTTIAVFFPMVFVKGVAGQIFGDMALTVVFSLLASLMVALFFIPMLASRQFRAEEPSSVSESPVSILKRFSSFTQFRQSLNHIRQQARTAWQKKHILLLLLLPLRFVYILARFFFLFLMNLLGKFFTLLFLFLGLLVKGVTRVFQLLLHKPLYFLTSQFNAGFRKLYRAYPGWLTLALNRRWVVLGSVGVLLLLLLWQVVPHLGRELIPEVHQGEFYVDITLPVGTPVETTIQTIRPIEEAILKYPRVAQVATVAGVDLTRITDSEAGEHTARITVTLKPSRNIRKSEEKTIAYIRDQLQNFGGMEYNISRPVLFSFKTPLEVEIKGYNLEELVTLSRQAVQRIARIPGVYDVKSNLQRGNPEVRIVYDRAKLEFYGLNILDVANIVRNKVLGEVATQFKEEERRIDIRVRIKEEDKASLEKLRRLNINPGGRVPIPLESVADIQIQEGPSEIRRINQQRAAVIMANVSGRDLMSVSSDVMQTMQTLDMPTDFTFDIAGQNKEMEVSLASLRLALLLAIFMVYIVMASQFESFLHPFVILITVPLAFIGVVFVLYLLHIPLNIMVFLGMIVLAGIVVNNAIVLVDYVNQLRRRGMAKREAIVRAGQARLRPILMTSLTTILGLLPMALGLGEGAEIRTPMAITVIAGLLSATVLTLIIIPVVYDVFERKD